MDAPVFGDSISIQTRQPTSTFIYEIRKTLFLVSFWQTEYQSKAVKLGASFKKAQNGAGVPGTDALIAIF